MLATVSMCNKYKLFIIPNSRCDIVIYNKKYIFGLHRICGTELLKPLEFLRVENNKDVFCYVNEVTCGPPLNDGGWLPGKPTENRRWELSVPPQTSREGGWAGG